MLLPGEWCGYRETCSVADRHEGAQQVAVDEVAVAVEQDVAVVPVLDLEQVRDDGVSCVNDIVSTCRVRRPRREMARTGQGFGKIPLCTGELG